MRRSSLFWAFVLILVGVVLLLQNLGVFAGLRISIWSIIWPLAIIGLGIWLIAGVLRRPRQPVVQEAAIPLEGASLGLVKIQHGAGRLRVAAGAAAGNLVEGSFAGGLQAKTQRSGDLLEVKMRVAEPVVAPFWNWAQGPLDWDVRLNAGIPLALACETGASSTELDLADLRVSELDLSTGASRTDVVLPSTGFTRVRIKAGAARVAVRVPGGVAARIRTKTGVATVDVDPTRFPATGDVYQSPDYESAADKAEIDIEAGVGSVSVQ